MIQRFTVPGRPVPKGRPRMNHDGIVYTPRATKDYESLVGWQARAQGVRVMSGPVKVRIVLRTDHRLDADNAAKGILDGLKGVAYHDDMQVMDLHVQRVAPPRPGADSTDVEIEDMEE